MKMDYTDAYKFTCGNSTNKINLVFEQVVPVLKRDPNSIDDIVFDRSEHIEVASLHMDIPFAKRLAEHLIQHINDLSIHKEG